MTIVIDDTFSRPQQKWRRVQTVELAGHKVKFVVERDSYDFQSRLYSEVWSPVELKWNRLQTLEGTDYKHLPSPYGQDEHLMRSSADEVIRVLFNYALDILS